MINFKELKIEGFASIVEPTEFKLDRDGLTTMRGRVGSGKTTVPSALSWCLYGQSLKDKSQIETWEEIRPKDYKGVMVSVSFEKAGHLYEIIRCKGYKARVYEKQRGGSKIFILRDGVDVLEINEKPYKGVKGKREQQKLIETLVGYSFDLFKSTIVFGQKMKRIIEETGPQKKKIFEEAFEAGFIEDARNNEKEELGKLKEAQYDIEDSLENLEDKITEQKELIEEALEIESNFEKEKELTLKEYRKELREYRKLVRNIKKEKYKGSTKEVDKTILQLEEKVSQINATNLKHDNLEKEIRNYSNKIKRKKEELKEPETTCPTCGNRLNKAATAKYKEKIQEKVRQLEEEKKEKVRELKKIVKIDYQDTQAKLRELRNKRDKIKVKMAKSQERQKTLPRLIEKSHQLRRKIKKLEDKKLTIRSTRYKDKLKRLEVDLNKREEELKRTKRKIEIKEWLIKDPLSNSGIKAYIFDSLMDKVNKRLTEYSRTLGFRVEFGIDLGARNKDFYQAILKDGIVIPYQDLSGGQKQLVDTSIAFAIHDVISSIRPTNIMFMDEPFESLGDEEIELIEELIENKAKDKTLYLITHHKSFNPRNANEIIFTLNKKGHTKIL